MNLTHHIEYLWTHHRNPNPLLVERHKSVFRRTKKKNKNKQLKKKKRKKEKIHLRYISINYYYS